MSTLQVFRCLSIPITMRAVLRKTCKEEKKELPPQGDSVLLHGSKDVKPDPNQNNTKFLFNDYNSLDNRRDMVNQHAGANNVLSPQIAASGFMQESVGSDRPIKGGGFERPVASGVTDRPFPSPAPDRQAQTAGMERPVTAFNTMSSQKASLPQYFLEDGKVAKVKKKKVDGDRKLSRDDISIETAGTLEHFGRRDLKSEKFSLTKRRSSNDLTDSTNDLAALREKVYGANFAKLSYMHKDIVRSKRQNVDGAVKKSPIVLDLTEIEAAKKAFSSVPAPTTSTINPALLKRSGIEIIPVPGSNTPISIPSSITVTPVVKGSEDKIRDKKDRRERKDLDRKERKRKRADSPNNKNPKIQIITTNTKNSTITSLEKLKSDNKVSVSNIKVPFQSPPKKPPISPSLSKSIALGKVTYSPTLKLVKPVYNSGSHQSPSYKATNSPKQCESPKQPNLSPKHNLLKPPMSKTTSPSFSRPSLSPKLTKNKERGSSCSPSRHSSPINSSPNISPILQGKKNPGPVRSNFSDGLTITKVLTGEAMPSTAHTSVSPSQSIPYNNMDKMSIEKAKCSPPKNRKGSSLSDIVDKLRAGASGSSGGVTIMERRERLLKNMQEGRQEGENFTVKPSTGLKITINKSKLREGSKQAINCHSGSQLGLKGSGNKASGLKPGVSSGPASKKISMSNFPPIPKLPRSSVSSVIDTSISPLNNAVSMAHSTPLQYQRERPKEKDRSQVVDKMKVKDTTKLCTSLETKKDSNRIPKEDIKLKSETTDDVDKVLKSMFGESPDEISLPDDYMVARIQLPKDITATKVLKGDRLKSDTIDLITGSRAMPPPSLPSKLHDKENVNYDEEKKSRDLSSSVVPNHCMSSKRSLSPPMSFPSSPSLSIKIVKSPAPVTSPLNMISPQSCQLSPCLIDDDLMDEALMGSRK